MTTKRTIWFFVALIVLVVVIAQLRGRGVEARNLVDGIAPASTAFANISGFADELANLPPGERAAHIQRTRPHLTEGVVYFLRGMGRIRPGERVERTELFFGSIKRGKALDGQGKVHDGYFEDELVIRVHLGGERTEDALVRCLNGMLELPRHLQSLQLLNSAAFEEVNEFTIARGEGLVHHVDYSVAIDLAERHSIALYRGGRQVPSARITPDEARRLENQTDWILVTAGVKEGDHFDLRNNTYQRR